MKNTNPPTIKQRIHIACNWLANFSLQHISPYQLNEAIKPIVTSKYTNSEEFDRLRLSLFNAFRAHQDATADLKSLIKQFEKLAIEEVDKQGLNKE